MKDDSASSLRESQDLLLRDLKAVMGDAEALLQQAVKEAGQGYKDARLRLEDSIEAARGDLAKLEEALVERALEAGRGADEYVRRHPWETAAVGIGIGLVIGVLLARK